MGEGEGDPVIDGIDVRAGRRARRAVPVATGICLLLVGSGLIADAPGSSVVQVPVGALVLAIGVAVVASPWARRSSRAVGTWPIRLRWAALTFGAVGLVAGGLLAARPVRVADPLFVPAGTLCGSAIQARRFSSTAIEQRMSHGLVSEDCNPELNRARGDTIFMSAVASLLMAWAVWDGALAGAGTRRKGGSAVVALSVGLLAWFSAATRSEVHAANSVRGSASAKPAIEVMCRAMTHWRADLVAASKPVPKDGGLEDRQAATVADMRRIEAATVGMVATLGKIENDYGSVAGVPELVGVIRARMSVADVALVRLLTDAQSMPVDSAPAFEAAKKRIADGVQGAGGIGPLFSGVRATRQVLTAAASMYDTSVCVPIVG